MARVHSVLGELSADELGVTFIHEHLYVKPSELPRHYPYTLDSIEKSVEEAARFKAAGGSTIVELSPLNFGRNTEGACAHFERSERQRFVRDGLSQTGTYPHMVL